MYMHVYIHYLEINIFHVSQLLTILLSDAHTFRCQPEGRRHLQQILQFVVNVV